MEWDPGRVPPSPNLSVMAGKALDTYFCADIPAAIWEEKASNMRTKKHPGSASLKGFTVPFPSETYFATEAFLRAIYLQAHQHSSRCTQGRAGIYGCALCMDQACRNGPTGPVQLELTRDSEDVSLPKVVRERTLAIEPLHAMPRSSYGLDQLKPLPDADSRAIVWEIHRGQIVRSTTLENVPEGAQIYTGSEILKMDANGNIVCFTPLITLGAGCNTAMYMLGTVEQAKAVCFYLFDYMTKDSVKLHNCLAAAAAARKKCSEYASKADKGILNDAEAASVYFAQVFLNTINGAKEISATQVLSCLLGGKNVYTSHGFWYLFTSAAVNWVESQRVIVSDDEKTEDFETILQNAGFSMEELAGNNNFENDDDEELIDDYHKHAEDDHGDGYGVLNVDKRGKISIQDQVTNIKYRGTELACVCAYEYAGMIKIVPRRDTAGSCDEECDSDGQEGENDEDNGDDGLQQETSTGAGRPTSKLYLFSKDHPAHFTHAQRINSKLLVPQLTGIPPKFPSSKTGKENDILRQKFALYILTLFKPWDLETFIPSGSITWSGFCDYVHHLASFPPLTAERGRLDVIINIARGLRISKVKKYMFTSFRGRAVKSWDELRKEKHDVNTDDFTPASVHEEADAIEKGERLADIMRASYMGLEAKSMKSAENVAKADKYVLNSIESLRTKFLPKREDVILAAGVDDLDLVQSHEVLTKDTLLRKYLKDGAIVSNSSKEEGYMSEEKTDKIPLNSPSCRGSFTHDERLPFPEVPCVKQDTPNAEQQIILASIRASTENKATEYMQFGRIKSPPNFRVLAGGPGNGKSFTIKHILLKDKLFLETAAVGVHIIVNPLSRVAGMTGTAGSNLGAPTAHSTVKIGYPRKNSRTGKEVNETLRTLKPLDDTQLALLQLMFTAGCVHLVIDEFTAGLGCVFLAFLLYRLRQIYGVPDNTLVGLPDITLVGDPQQLTLGGKTLIEGMLALMDNNENPKYPTGSAIRFGAEVFRQFQWHFLHQNERYKNDLQFKGFMDRLRDWRIDYPVTEELLRYLASKQLSPADYDYFNDTPIVATSNQERLCMSQPILITDYAIRTGNVCIHWQKPVSDEDDSLNGVDPQIRDHYYKLYGSHLYEYFCKGVPGFLTVNYGPERGIGNGTPAFHHSLVFKSVEDEEKVRQLISTRSGNVVDISPIVPIAIRLRIEPHIAAAWPASYKDTHGDWIVACTTKKTAVYRLGPTKTVVKVKEFQCELGFVITFYKVQGRTVKGIILQLLKREGNLKSIDLQSIIVGCTRVTKGEDLRIMPLDPNFDAVDQLRYLLNLRTNPSLQRFYAGFEKDKTTPGWTYISPDEWKDRNNKQKKRKRPNTFCPPKRSKNPTIANTLKHKSKPRASVAVNEHFTRAKKAKQNSPVLQRKRTRSEFGSNGTPLLFRRPQMPSRGGVETHVNSIHFVVHPPHVQTLNELLQVALTGQNQYVGNSNIYSTVRDALASSVIIAAPLWNQGLNTYHLEKQKQLFCWKHSISAILGCPLGGDDCSLWIQFLISMVESTNVRDEADPCVSRLLLTFLPKSEWTAAYEIASMKKICRDAGLHGMSDYVMEIFLNFLNYGASDRELIFIGSVDKSRRNPFASFAQISDKILDSEGTCAIIFFNIRNSAIGHFVSLWRSGDDANLANIERADIRWCYFDSISGLKDDLTSSQMGDQFSRQSTLFTAARLTLHILKLPSFQNVPLHTAAVNLIFTRLKLAIIDGINYRLCSLVDDGPRVAARPRQDSDESYDKVNVEHFVKLQKIIEEEHILFSQGEVNRKLDL